MVKFNLVPNSVFTPRLKCLSPILKNACNRTASVEVAPLNSPNISLDGTSVNSCAGENKPALCRIVTSENKRESMYNFSTCVAKDDFARICLKATQDFIIVREMITNSRSMKSSTSFTLRRKENLSGTNAIAETMKDFYTSTSLNKHSVKLSEFKPSIPLLEMEI